MTAPKAGDFLALAVKSSLSKKGSAKKYLKEVEGKSDSQVNEIIEAVKTEFETTRQE